MRVNDAVVLACMVWAVLVLGSLLVSPEVWVDLSKARVTEGLVVAAIRITLLSSPIHCQRPLELRRFAALPRSRQAGYYLGVRTAKGRIIWFAYARHRRLLMKQTEKWQRVLEPLRR